MVKRNFDGQMYDYINDMPQTEPIVALVDTPNGKEQKVVAEKPVTFRMIAQRACMNAFRSDEDMTGDTKGTLFALGIKLARGGEQDFEVEELATIKERVRKGFIPGLTGQMDALIKGPTEEAKPEKQEESDGAK